MKDGQSPLYNYLDKIKGIYIRIEYTVDLIHKKKNKQLKCCKKNIYIHI